MRKIIKDQTPDFWSSFVRKHPQVRYRDLKQSEEGIALRIQLRKHLVEHQKWICCYCCGAITLDNAHNEHIQAQDFHPNATMEYNNLLASCTNSKHCGMKKDNADDLANFVSPLQSDCESHFYFLPDGRIGGTSDAGEATIQCLNLNDYSIVEARKNLYLQCVDMARYIGKEYVYSTYIKEDAEGKLPRFVDMVTYFYQNGDFDSDVCQDIDSE